MDLKGRLLFLAFFGLAVNGVLYFFHVWMPYLLALAIACLIVGFLLPSDNSSNM